MGQIVENVATKLRPKDLSFLHKCLRFPIEQRLNGSQAGQITGLFESSTLAKRIETLVFQWVSLRLLRDPGE